MRTVILLGAVLISGAINPTQEMSDRVGTFLAIVLAAAMIMDLAEFFTGGRI